MAEIVTLNVSKEQAKKLEGGKVFQMTHNHIMNGHPDGIEVELHLSKKGHNRLHRNIRDKKGNRFKSEEIVGGKIHWKKIGHQIAHAGRKIMRNPVVKKLAKELGHLAVATGTQVMANQGVDVTPYTNLAHKAIESKNISKELQHQVAEDALGLATSQAGQFMGGALLPNGAIGGKMKLGTKILKGIGKVLKNPIVQGVSTNLLSAALMGAGAKKRHAKGSQEAKDHMAKLRSMRKKKGGALMMP